MRTAGFAIVVAVGCGLAFAACRPDVPVKPRGRAREDRQRVVRFWDLYNDATRLRVQGERARAVNAYREALSLDDRHEDSLYYLGQLLLEMQRPAQAQEAWERLVAVNPHSARGHMALGALASNRVHGPLDLDQAEGHYRRAHEINGEETGPMLRLAEVLILAGRSGEAAEWLDAVSRTNHKSVEAALLASHLAHEAGDTLRAEVLFEQARDAARADALIKGVLGEGDRKSAQPSKLPPLPLESPMGATIFGRLAVRLRAEGDGADRIASYRVFAAIRRAEGHMTSVIP